MPVGSYLDFAVTFDAGSLDPGDYDGTLDYVCSDTENPNGSLPVSLHVSQPVEQIPTLSEWGLILLGLLLLAAGTAAVIRRRSPTAVTK